MEEKTITLIRKQPTPFTVNYPYQLNNGGINPKFVWQGTKGSILNEKKVPVEVFEWLRDYTGTFKTGMLIVKEEDINDQDIEEIVQTLDDEKDISKAIKTEEEVKEMLSKGNQLVLKKELDKLIEGVEDEQKIKEIKNYIYKTAIEIGVDSSAKRKVIVDWVGDLNYEDVESLFDKVLDEIK